MIVALAFGQPEILPDGRSLRRAAFHARSELPLSAACLIGNGVRQELARLLAIELETEVTEPALPDAAARAVLLADAIAYRVSGQRGDAFVMVRARDARRLVAAAFGERERPDGVALSAIERTTLERLIGALVPLCATLCGTVRAWEPESRARLADAARTYFEVRVVSGVEAALGFALATDPAPSIGEPLGIDDVAAIEIECSVEFARGSVGAAAFARLEPGAVLHLDTRLGAPGILRVAGVPLALGTCGAREGRASFALADDGWRDVA